MKFTFLLSVSAFAHCIYTAQTSADPADKYAEAILLTYEQKVHIKSATKVMNTTHWKLLITSPAGDEHADVMEGYDGFTSQVQSITGRLYNAQGEEIKRLRNNDLKDEAPPGSSVDLANNYRVRYGGFAHRQYPYMVEYTVETECRQSFFLPHFQPQFAHTLSVRAASYELRFPASMPIQQYSHRVQKKSSMLDGKDSVIVYAVNNAPAHLPVAYADDLQLACPSVFLNSGEIEMGGITGSTKSWADMGSFQWKLNQDRQRLPQHTLDAVAKTVHGLSTTQAKVWALYRYMQQQTRYISIQLGIGGWQPIAAEEVLKKGYGDCKALSNLMVALLGAAGIDAYYCIIRAGQGNKLVRPELPIRNFNHVIVAVPVPGDTLWLECTSQTNIPNETGQFTDNRYALMVKPGGQSVLVKTPAFTHMNNQRHSHTLLTLDAEGAATMQVQVQYTGLYASDRKDLEAMPPHQKRVRRDADFALTDYAYAQKNYQELPSTQPLVSENYHVEVASAAARAGRRLLLRPWLGNAIMYLPDSTLERSSPILCDPGYSRTDSVEIVIPQGFTIEKSITPVVLNTTFGQYESSFVTTGDKHFYRRYCSFYLGRYAPENYPAFLRFVAAVNRADAARLVLVRNP